MSLFLPDFMFDKVWRISGEFLKQNRIRALILDVDNTLALHDSRAVDKRVLGWLSDMKRAGVSLIIVSNNREERVRPFAEGLSLSFVARGKKPLPTGIIKASGIMKIPLKETALIGDQIFTDILGGNLGGAKTILVKPFSFEGEGRGIALKRILERPFVKSSIRKRGGYL